jgi:phosphoglycerate kinase
MLENLRFHEEEELNGADFAKELSKYADFYVNDAFGVCHREHASVHAIIKYLPGCIGLLVEKELKIFAKLDENPQRPYIAILGGSKLETKIPIIRRLLDNVDKLLIGGAMIFTFYRAKGYSVGKSLVDKEHLTMAKMLNNNEKIILPEDVIIADDKDHPTQVLDFSPKQIPSYMIGLDLGEKSIKQFKEELANAKTVVWNGPLGYYENKAFLKSTVSILKYLASKPDIKTIIGGGDTVAIVEQLGLRDKFFHVSTGGGASMTLLEGKPLPAIEILRNKK